MAKKKEENVDLAEIVVIDAEVVVVEETTPGHNSRAYRQ